MIASKRFVNSAFPYLSQLVYVRFCHFAPFYVGMSRKYLIVLIYLSTLPLSIIKEKAMFGWRGANQWIMRRNL
jgi:hypothetical protein